MSGKLRGALFATVACALILFLNYKIFVGALRNQYHFLLSEEEQTSSSLMDLREEVQKNERYLQRFARHRAFRQHVLRERLGLAEPDELVFVFEDRSQ